MFLNERISAIIQETGIKKVEFARRLKLSSPYISELCSGKTRPSDRTITDICREFDVSEHWLRTGEGEMFVKKTPSDEIAAFIGDILSDEPDFRQRFIAVLARMTADEWKILEKKVVELAEEVKKPAPDGTGSE